MIYFFTPYGFDGNLGRAYNEYCKLVPDDSWICFLDGDIMLLNKDWGHHLEEIVNKYPDTGLFTCVTNRVACTDQCYGNVISDNDSVISHRKIALELESKNRLDVEVIKYPISGYLMMFRKDVWREVGGFCESVNPVLTYKIKRNIAGVDNDFSERILNKGYKIRICKGFYVLHYYRMIEGIEFKEHIR